MGAAPGANHLQAVVVHGETYQCTWHRGRYIAAHMPTTQDTGEGAGKSYQHLLLNFEALKFLLWNEFTQKKNTLTLVCGCQCDVRVILTA